MECQVCKGTSTHFLLSRGKRWMSLFVHEDMKLLLSPKTNKVYLCESCCEKITSMNDTLMTYISRDGGFKVRFLNEWIEEFMIN